jgi:hypothetical protein
VWASAVHDPLGGLEVVVQRVELLGRAGQVPGVAERDLRDLRDRRAGVADRRDRRSHLLDRLPTPTGTSAYRDRRFAEQF